MEESAADLDRDGRSALAAARAGAAALGDRYVGTEHLLLGVFATATGELAEVGELFVLDRRRIEWAIRVARSDTGADHRPGDGGLTDRARAALGTRRHDGTGPTGPFEVLLGALADQGSGACRVLRELGVRAEEVRRLAALGTRHLDRAEAAALLDLLDRRRPDRHHPWWGPRPEALPVPVPELEGREVARSTSAVARLRAVAASPDGVALSLSVVSLRPWLLPPVLQAPEILVPGRASHRKVGPEVLRVEVGVAGARWATSLAAVERFSGRKPRGPVLTLLASREERHAYNDRRRSDERHVDAHWWLWPLPPAGPVEIRVGWPAEVLAGEVHVEGHLLLRAAQARHAAR